MIVPWKIIAASLIGSGVLVTSAIGVVSADNRNNGNVGSSGIPKSVFRTERQVAAAAVLNTTTANIQAAHHNHTFKQLLQQNNLSPKSYAQKLKAELTKDLEAKGYSQQQVTIALQRKEIVRLHHKLKGSNTSSSNIPSAATT